MSSRPTGTVTFLFTDIEGSTRLWEEHPEGMKAALARHDEILRSAIEDYGGYVFSTAGDAFSASFHRAQDAVGAALAAQEVLVAEDWGDLAIGVRMGLHTGEADERDGDYFGSAVNRTARLLSAGHGGQVLVSRSMREIVEHQLADDVGLADLGVHRLRDLDRPEHVFQLTHGDLPADFPPLSTMSGTPSNLPAEVNSFVGREREVEEIRSLLASSRLVTLLGMGGVGKSRLAVRAARSLTDAFRDGTWLVDLSGVSDPAHIAPAVGSIWDLPPEQDGSVQALCSFLRDQQLLLVLDNCEAVAEGAALLAEELLAAVPELRILATSREPLQSQGEVLWRVVPLELPSEPLVELSVDDLVACAAVRLFGDRASSVVPGFQLDRESAVRSAQICGLLDGIPLAIELAAARVRNMTLAEIEAGLDDRFVLLVGGARATPSRHRALEATIDWSYELLDRQERELFGRLGVFRTSFPLTGAEVICGGEGIDDTEVRELLGRLVDKSLLIHEERDGRSWYELLVSLRRYAYEKIARGHAPLNDRGFLLNLAQRTDPRLRGPEDRMWSVLLEGERHAVRTALEVAHKSWREDQGSFLAGVAAASVTQTGRLGFLGGMSPTPPGGRLATNKHLPVRDQMARFRNGFVAGVRHVDPNLEVHETYLTEQEDFVSAFEDPSHGREAASELYSKGCDVVAHAAGQSGSRIFEAARRMSEDTDTYRWGIGADYDEYLIQPDQLKPHVLASVVKQVPIDVLSEIKNAIITGDPEQAPQFDLSNKGVRLSTSGGHLEGVAATLEDLREQIMSGEIDVSGELASE